MKFLCPQKWSSCKLNPKRGYILPSSCLTNIQIYNTLSMNIWPVDGQIMTLRAWTRGHCSIDNDAVNMETLSLMYFFLLININFKGYIHVYRPQTHWSISKSQSKVEKWKNTFKSLWRYKESWCILKGMPDLTICSRERRRKQRNIQCRWFRQKWSWL